MGPLIAALAISTLLGWIIGSTKGRGVEGFFLGLILPGIGWIIAMLMKPTVTIQAQRDVAIEQARDRIRQEALEQARAELRDGYVPDGSYAPPPARPQPPVDPWDNKPMRRR